MTVKLMEEMSRRDHETGLVTMCVGGGQGVATIFERAGIGEEAGTISDRDKGVGIDMESQDTIFIGFRLLVVYESRSMMDCG